MPHKHSVTYITKEECELKKQFHLLYISEVKSTNGCVAFFVAVQTVEVRHQHEDIMYIHLTTSRLSETRPQKCYSTC